MRRTAGLLAGIALLAGCAGEPTATASADAAADAGSLAARLAQGENEHADVAALRAATARFHRIEVADAAGYDTQFPPGCFAIAEGAMGFHYLNGAAVGTLDVTRPQLVMYEPQKDGTMKLVGVEFIYPGLPTDPPPVLFGRAFQYNHVFSVWALHVWAWRENPRGLYADWNPLVSCEHASAVTTASHH